MRLATITVALWRCRAFWAWQSFGTFRCDLSLPINVMCFVVVLMLVNG
jgi:hypothetical protein